jgi:O-antigen ligase
LDNRFFTQVRVFFQKGFPAAAQVFLSLYLVLIISLYPESINYCNNLSLFAFVCGVGLFILFPLREKPVWPYWVFISTIMGFYLLNVLSVHWSDNIPGIGHSTSSWKHLPGLLLALSTGISLRNRKSASRLLAVLLVVSGLWYLGEMVSMPWRSVWQGNRYVGSREFHTILAMELLPLFSLYLSSALLVKNRRTALLALSGAVLIGVVILLNKTRFVLLTMGFVTIPSAIVLQNRFGNLRNRLAAACLWVIVIAPAIGLIWYLNASPERRSFNNASLRVAAWKISMQITEQSPGYRILIGHGRFPHTFDALASYYRTDYDKINKIALVRGQYHHAHNVLLQTFLETGILGVIALVCIWLAAFYRALSAWVKQKEPQAISGVMVVTMITIAVMAQMDYCFYGVAGFLCWFLIGLAFASSAENEIKENPAVPRS